ncbi:MAG: helix-turn-helix domain-containing protein [Planctomycetia bacterium]|nr:helix-turn-helix domain-containing protein [Planctomycetia bacterium]
MGMTLNYQPDYAVAPGVTLKEVLEERGLSQTELCVRTEISEKTISQIVNGVAPLTTETADKLELALGIPARFWNTRELHFREALARTEDEKRLAGEAGWLTTIPVRTLIERGFLLSTDNKGALVRQTLKFFGVSSVAAWRETWLDPCALYRGGLLQQRKPGHVAAWLRIGELVAAEVPCERFDAKLFRQALHQVRRLSVEPASHWRSRIRDYCASAGVAVVFVPEIAGASVSGVTKWATADKALLGLSLKYKTDDQLWFTFFHEAAHILLHGKRRVFIEDGSDPTTDEEKEADAFARDTLIPPTFSAQLRFLKSKAAIRSFAHALGIAPGIVVGRLQRDGVLPHSHCNDLKRKLAWAKAKSVT